MRPKRLETAKSLGATFTTVPTVLQSISGVNYSVSWSGTTPVGTITIEASDDYVPDTDGSPNSSGTWNPVPLMINGVYGTTIAVSGNTGKGMIDIYGIAAYAVRFVYTRSSGTGTMNVVVTGKVA